MMITADAEMSSVLGKDISLKNLMVTHKKMNEAINDVVDHMTLQDLVDYEMKECSDYVI